MYIDEKYKNHLIKACYTCKSSNWYRFRENIPDNVNFDTYTMRDHLIKCIGSQQFSPFPKTKPTRTKVCRICLKIWYVVIDVLLGTITVVFPATTRNTFSGSLSFTCSNSVKIYIVLKYYIFTSNFARIKTYVHFVNWFKLTIYHFRPGLQLISESKMLP
jgi:hypothetical protein